MRRWSWPADRAGLIELQLELAEAARWSEAWTPPGRPLAVGAVFAAAERGLAGPGAPGDPAWAAAVLMKEGLLLEQVTLVGEFRAAYAPGLLALRAGPILEAVARLLHTEPDVLLVDATGADHPRGGGLAIHLGAVLEMPTVGVTDRALSDVGASKLVVTRAGARPLHVHAGWRTDTETAVEIVVAACSGSRTPEPLRQARRLARAARSEFVGLSGPGHDS